MVANGLVILLLLVFIGIWARRAKGYGAFSAFLAMICVIAAGGIAFALWEPIAYAFLLKPGTEDFAWTLALILPFIVSLVILRLIVDSIVKSNVQLDDVTSFALAGVCAIVSGVVTTGMIVISVGFLRFPGEMLMWQPVESWRDGNLVYSKPLWVPVDKITAKLYEHLSFGSFDIGTPLATYQPDVHVQSGMVRMTFDGVCRNGIQPEDFEVKGHYVLAPGAGATSILSDSNIPKRQTVVYFDGSEVVNGSTLHGYLMQFNSTAREKGGSIILTPAQLRLICEREDGTAIGVHPCAVVATPSGVSNAIKRFRFDFQNSVISSVGGGQTAEFAFEFIVPPGLTPLHLLVKNVRVDVVELAQQWAGDVQNPDGLQRDRSFATVEDRDAAIADRSLFTDAGLGTGSNIEYDNSEAETVSTNREGAEGLVVSAQFPRGYIINRSEKGGLTVVDNKIVDGRVSLTTEQVSGRPDRALQVRAFDPPSGTGIVQVEIFDSGRKSIYGRAVDRAQKVTEQPLLVDSNGNTYPAIGYIHDDGSTVEFRLTPQDLIRNLDSLPPISQSATGDIAQWLIFAPTRGVYITKFVLGNRVVAEFAGDGILVK